MIQWLGDMASTADVPIDRTLWFRRRAIEVVGAKVLEAYGIDAETGQSEDLALIAVIVAGVAYWHTCGVPLGESIEWAQQRLEVDAERARDLAVSAYRRFRAGDGVPGLVWNPDAVYRGMLTWFESQQGTSHDLSQGSVRIAEAWLLGQDGASEVERHARSWESLVDEPFALRHPGLAESAAQLDLGTKLDRLSPIGRASRPLRAVAYDLAIKGSLSGRREWADQLDRLMTDVERRFELLTEMEQILLTLGSLSPAVLGWAEHRNSVYHATELRVRGKTVMACMNGVCDRLERDSLIPDWIEQEVFNGRYMAGISRGGPTATAWILPSDIGELATLELDVDLEPNTLGKADPPAIAIYWRDASRAPNDWSWVSLLIGDYPEAWSWLAVLVITRRLKIDVLALDSDGDLQLIGGGVATLDEDFFSPWLERFPEPPAYVARALEGVHQRHVIGGLQAAERSKSYDILDLAMDHASDPRLLQARRDVLVAESRRADRIWGLAEVDDAEAARSWIRFRELQAWAFSEKRKWLIDHDVWLRDLTDGVTSETRAIVHMMVEDDGLTLFWVAGDGAQRGSVSTSVAINRLLAALQPWSQGSSLCPRAGADPVGEMVAAATPVADALCELASEQGFDHLVLVPWRGLHCVPWTALTLSDGQPLRQRIRVTHAPAIRLLRRSTGERLGARSAVAIAVHGGTLARADAETQIVADITAAAIVADGSPSQEIVRAMSAANVVHIAGHGAPGPGPFAAALLAGKPPLEPSRVLSSARIHADADLSRCDLVVINTCDSGRYAPMPRAFENHTGLDTACLCAGATVVISTLWPVNDMVATIVAAVTHWHLASGLSPHRSLESAIAVLRDGHGSSGIPEGLRSSLDARLGARWRDQLDAGVIALRHPYWWAAWRISGSDWLLE